MNIELHAGGKVKMAAPQQKWIGDELLQAASFAGEQLVAVTDDAGHFDLQYLGFMASGFTSLEDAKSAAPGFAKAVLERMAGLISDGNTARAIWSPKCSDQVVFDGVVGQGGELCARVRRLAEKVVTVRRAGAVHSMLLVASMHFEESIDGQAWHLEVAYAPGVRELLGAHLAPFPLLDAAEQFVNAHSLE